MEFDSQEKKLPTDVDSNEMTRTSNERPSADSAEAIPVKIGPYFVLRELGRGGFGKVLLAKDTQVQRLVAIKVLRSDRRDSSRSVAALLAEARTLAQLEHPNIANVYDCGETPEGEIYFVMKYVEGSTLQEALTKESFDEARCAGIVAAIADALDYAHKRGVYHRDVKPPNILLDTQGTPYLTDFGLALSDSIESYEYGLAGTLPYMSPEQFLSDTRAIDGRTDIWSLGVVLYELLTKKRPFRANTKRDWMEAIQQFEAKPVKSLNASVSPAMEAICHKCLRKNPSERFATAGDLVSELRKVEAAARKSRVVFHAIVASAAAMVVLSLGAVWAMSDDFFPRGKERLPLVGASDTSAPQQTPHEEIETNLDLASGDATPQGALPPLQRSLPESPIQLTPLSWSDHAPENFFEPTNANGGWAVMSLAHRAAFATHSPQGQPFTFRLRATPQREIAILGALVGIHEIGGDPPEARCVSIAVHYDYPSPGTWIIAEACRLGRNDIGQRTFVDRREVFRKEISVKKEASADLVVRIEAGRVDWLQYNQQRIEGIAPALANEVVPEGSWCGILALDHVVFHNIESEEE